MSRSSERAARIQEAVTTQEALKRLRAQHRRIWSAYAAGLALSPAVYWIGKPALWMFYGALWMLLLGLDLLIGQRMYVHQKQRAEAAIVGAVLPVILFSALFILYVGLRMILAP